MKLDRRLVALLEPTFEDSAAKLLWEYFAPCPPGTFTGSQFERLGGGGDQPTVAFEYTAEDLIAVTMLAVEIRREVALHILVTDRNRLSELLRQIPMDLDLVGVDPAAITPDWPAWRLYDSLLAVHHLGRTTVTKLIARKRPRLIPIYDTEINRTLGLEKGAHWQPLAAELRAQNRRLHDRLVELHAKAGLGPEVSPLRVLDVLAWRVGKGHADGLGLPNDEGE